MNAKVKTLSLILLIAVSNAAEAQTTVTATDSEPQELISIKGLRFVDSLLEKWIADYSKSHPGVSLSIAGKDVQDHSIEVLPFEKQDDDSSPNRPASVSFGRYAILPIAGNNDALPEDLKKKKLNEKRLKELFFEKDDFEEDQTPDKKEKYNTTVYSGNSALSVSHPFAEHFGYETGNLKGKRIAGDDIYLNNAVKKDVRGISFNPLNYVFNTKSRQLNDGITLLPLDVKKEYAEILASQNLDETITLLENKDLNLIPVKELTFVLPEKVSPVVLQFLEWVLDEGQESIHSFGFLRLDDKTLAQQRKQISQLGIRKQRSALAN